MNNGILTRRCVSPFLALPYLATSSTEYEYFFFPLTGRCLVADVAMGETPTYGKRKVNISRHVNASTSFNTSSNPKELKKDSKEKEKEKKGKTNTTLPVSSSSNGAEAEAISNVEAAIAAATCSRGSTSEGCEGSGLDSSGDGDGPLDASGRPGWPSSSSSSVRNSTFGASAVTGSTGGHDEKDMATADADNAIGTGSSTSTTDAVFKTVEWYGTIRLLVFVRKGKHPYPFYRTSTCWYNIVVHTSIAYYQCA